MKKSAKKWVNSRCRTWTCDTLINSQLRYLLRQAGMSISAKRLELLVFRVWTEGFNQLNYAELRKRIEVLETSPLAWKASMLAIEHHTRTIIGSFLKGGLPTQVDFVRLYFPSPRINETKWGIDTIKHYHIWLWRASYIYRLFPLPLSLTKDRLGKAPSPCGSQETFN